MVVAQRVYGVNECVSRCWGTFEALEPRHSSSNVVTSDSLSTVASRRRVESSIVAQQWDDLVTGAVAESDSRSRRASASPLGRSPASSRITGVRVGPFPLKP